MNLGLARWRARTWSANMTVAAVTSTTWSAGVAVTADTPVQNVGSGDILVAWDNGVSAPSVGDGLRLRPGEALIVPENLTIYYSLHLAGTASSVFYEPFA